MNQPQLIPKRRKRKRQPTASMYREQLRLAADRIIELERVIDTTKRLMGWDRPPVELEFSYRERWWRRLWNRLRVRVVETDKRTAAEQVAVMEEARK